MPSLVHHNPHAGTRFDENDKIAPNFQISFHLRVVDRLCISLISPCNLKIENGG